MPIYEYKCKECNKISEFLVGVVQQEPEISAKGGSASGRKCNHCGSHKLDKIFSKSFISKGSNFIGSQDGRTCCGRDERCDVPLCSDDGICKR